MSYNFFVNVGLWGVLFDLVTGRHTRTIDRIFKKPIYEFIYAGNLLTAIVKSSGESVKLSYGGSSADLKVRFIGEDRLDYDSSGRLVAVIGPQGKTYQMSYVDNGDLLASFT